MCPFSDSYHPQVNVIRLTAATSAELKILALKDQPNQLGMTGRYCSNIGIYAISTPRRVGTHSLLLTLILAPCESKFGTLLRGKDDPRPPCQAAKKEEVT